MTEYNTEKTDRRQAAVSLRQLSFLLLSGDFQHFQPPKTNVSKLSGLLRTQSDKSRDLIRGATRRRIDGKSKSAL